MPDSTNNRPSADHPTHDCLQCGYPRTGLSATAPCPECGTVPDPTVTVLPGWSSAGSATGTIVFGSLVAAIGVFLWMPSAVGAMQPAYLLVPVGALTVVFGLRRRGMDPCGGDLRWVLGQEGLRVEGGLRARRLAWEEIDRLVVTRHAFSKWISIDVRFRPLVLALSSPRIAVRRDRVDVDAFARSASRWTKVFARRFFGRGQRLY